MNGTGIIYADDDSEATSALFGRTSAATQEYIHSNIQNYVSQIGEGVSNIADSVMARYNEINNSAVVNRIENMRNRLNAMWQSDTIRHLHTLNDLQQAPIVMQRWIMAEPTIRASFNRDGCSRYDGKYIDVRPGGVGNTHYDYRRVMNGVVDEGSYTNFYEPLIDPADVLTTFEKAAITATWNVINGMIDESNTDVTDPWANGTMV